MDKNNIYLNRLGRIFGIDKEESKENLSSSLCETMPPYSIIENVYIQDSWKNHKDYPEPPNEKEQPTEESKAIYDKYRSDLLKFSNQRIEECKS
jgi:hypothetical protein